MPSFARLSFRALLRRPSLITALSFSIIAVGRCRRQHSVPVEADNSLNAQLLHRRHVRQFGGAAVAGHAERAQLPGLDEGFEVADVVRIELHLPRDQVNNCRCRAAIGNMDDLDAGALLQELTEQV